LETLEAQLREVKKDGERRELEAYNEGMRRQGQVLNEVRDDMEERDREWTRKLEEEKLKNKFVTRQLRGIRVKDRLQVEQRKHQPKLLAGPQWRNWEEKRGLAPRTSRPHGNNTSRNKGRRPEPSAPSSLAPREALKRPAQGDKRVPMRRVSSAISRGPSSVLGPQDYRLRAPGATTLNVLRDNAQE
jgi:hypothetical protein